MKIMYFFLIILVSLTFFSCDSSTEKEIAQIEQSLVYIRGEDSNQQDLISSATGFIIAKEDSFFSNKYFLLTAKHSIRKSGSSVNFKAIPFWLAEEYILDKQKFMNKTKVYQGDKNELKLDLVVELDDIDVSIMSFDSNQKLPVPFISYHKPLPQKKLAMHGFIRCILSERQNKYFSYYSTKGEIVNIEYINRVEKEESHRNSLIQRLNSIDEKHKKQGEGIDLRYSNPSRDGMSGSPITVYSKAENKAVIVGIQNRKLISEDEPNTCALAPEKPYSYGTSINKILSAKNFPENIKKLVKIDRPQSRF
jgi:hypothetical protein